MIGFEDFSLQGKEISSLRSRIEEGRLVHAILITGEPGTGKRTLAMLLASALMCKTGSGIPCGTCSGCRLAASGEHPDITVIEKGIPLSPDTAKGRSTIPVDDIREMIRICSQYPYEGGNRAMIIRDAENMTVQAQNCLLKILEEPPANTYFLMTSAHPEQLLVTVRSRCRPVRLKPWNEEYIQKLLMDSGIDRDKASKPASVSSGSIGTAFALIADDAYWQMRDEVMNAFFRCRKRSDVLMISSGWKDRKADSDRLFAILEHDLRSLLRFRTGSGEKPDLSEFPAEWKRFAAEADPERFSRLSDRISEARRQNAFNVNYQAVIEQLLLAFIGESDQWVN